MRCPFCDSEEIEIVETGYLAIEESKNGSEKIYDEGLVHYRCSNEHIFFAQTEKQANRAAEEARIGRLL